MRQNLCVDVAPEVSVEHTINDQDREQAQDDEEVLETDYVLHLCFDHIFVGFEEELDVGLCQGHKDGGDHKAPDAEHGEDLGGLLHLHISHVSLET